LEAVDWQAEEIIVVASSSFDHYESEQRTIASVSADGLTITVTEPFKYRHYSAV
jgi:predicted class III extradiol MEMO1 family dioxygenase